MRSRDGPSNPPAFKMDSTEAPRILVSMPPRPVKLPTARTEVRRLSSSPFSTPAEGKPPCFRASSPGRVTTFHSRGLCTAGPTPEGWGGRHGLGAVSWCSLCGSVFWPSCFASCRPAFYSGPSPTNADFRPAEAGSDVASIPRSARYGRSVYIFSTCGAATSSTAAEAAASVARNW